MTVKELVATYLREHNYDGLWNPDGECACLASDLCPCGEPMDRCEPGHKTPCDCGEHDWHIAAKPAATGPE
jgi:hypothetical protein